MISTIFLFVSVFFPQIFVKADPIMYKLYRDLTNNYTRDIRPSRNHSRALNVTFGFALTQIIDVDERNQIVTTNAWLNQVWLDYNLRWDPREYGNITKMHIPNDRLWKPDIVLYNNADSQYNDAIMSTDVFVNYQGNVSWLAAAIFKSSCQMDVQFYPFDEQICNLTFASWAYDGTLLDIILVSSEGDDSNYMRSTEWDLADLRAVREVEFYSCCPEPFPKVTITFKIRRKPMFYVFNLILPCVLITGVALLGFYMPSESGEKVTLGITTLLSMTVFLMLVAESMPPTSDTLPLIGMYYGVTICLVSFATAMTVFTLNIHHKGLRGGPVPDLVKTIAFKYLARILCVQLEQPRHPDRFGPVRPKEKTDEDQPLTEVKISDPNEGGAAGMLPNGAPANCSFRRKRNVSYMNAINQSVPSSVKDEFEFQFMRVLNKIYNTIERNEMRLAEQDLREAIRLEWQQVALVIDRLLLVLFVVGTAAISLLIMYQRELHS